MNLRTTDLPVAPAVRGRTPLVATGFAGAAMIMYFAGVFGVYLKERAQVRSEGLPWIPNKATIELTQPGMVIWPLLISIVVMQWAVYSIKRDDRQHALLGIGTTLVMGAMVVVQTAWHLSQTNLIADEGPTTAATLIFTIVGSYLVAVIIGMIILLLTGFRTMAGQYGSTQTDGVVAASLYWYSLVFIYFIIWIAVYIAK